MCVNAITVFKCLTAFTSLSNYPIVFAYIIMPNHWQILVRQMADTCQYLPFCFPLSTLTQVLLIKCVHKKKKKNHIF